MQSSQTERAETLGGSMKKQKAKKPFVMRYATPAQLGLSPKDVKEIKAYCADPKHRWPKAWR
jgi:hypothetical protein